MGCPSLTYHLSAEHRLRCVYNAADEEEGRVGLPLDIRRNYTKSDWVIWSACLAPTQEEFDQFVTLIYKYANETPSRIPLSDWHDTETAKHMNFKARSVVGAYFMKILEMKIKENN